MRQPGFFPHGHALWYRLGLWSFVKRLATLSRDRCWISPNWSSECAILLVEKCRRALPRQLLNSIRGQKVGHESHLQPASYRTLPHIGGEQPLDSHLVLVVQGEGEGMFWFVKNNRFFTKRSTRQGFLLESWRYRIPWRLPEGRCLDVQASCGANSSKTIRLVGYTATDGSFWIMHPDVFPSGLARRQISTTEAFFSRIRKKNFVYLPSREMVGHKANGKMEAVKNSPVGNEPKFRKN